MYVYWWYDEELHAIKIGMGRDSAGRRDSYSEVYGMRPKNGTLKSRLLPSRDAAKHVEQRTHWALRTKGFRHLRLQSTKGTSTAAEVFALGGSRTYAEADELVAAIIASVIGAAPKRVMRNAIEAEEYKRQADMILNEARALLPAMQSIERRFAPVREALWKIGRDIQGGVRYIKNTSSRCAIMWINSGYLALWKDDRVPFKSGFGDNSPFVRCPVNSTEFISGVERCATKPSKKLTHLDIQESSAFLQGGKRDLTVAEDWTPKLEKLIERLAPVHAAALRNKPIVEAAQKSLLKSLFGPDPEDLAALVEATFGLPMGSAYRPR
ncbi:MAG: hypothetical protein ACK4JB_02755 [Reyranella sp.]